jgi:hypothetical protein
MKLPNMNIRKQIMQMMINQTLGTFNAFSIKYQIIVLISATPFQNKLIFLILFRIPDPPSLFLSIFDEFSAHAQSNLDPIAIVNDFDDVCYENFWLRKTFGPYR